MEHGEVLQTAGYERWCVCTDPLSTTSTWLWWPTASSPISITVLCLQIKSKRDQKPEVRQKAREAALKEIKARQKAAKTAGKAAKPAAQAGAKVAAGKKAQPKSGGRK